MARPSSAEMLQELKAGGGRRKSAAEMLQELRGASPIDSMNMGEKLLAGYGKGVMDLYRGGKQLLNIGDQEALQREIDDAKATDAALMGTGWGKAGHFLGSAITSVPAAMVPGGQGVLGGAAVGGLMGMLTPTATGDDPYETALFGAGLGAAGPFVGRAAKSGYDSVVRPFFQSGRERMIGETLRDAAGSRLDDVLDSIDDAKEFVPGSFPTLAEASKNRGLALLQKSVRNLPADISGGIVDREMSNAAARRSSLLNIAGDDAAYQSALGKRAGSTQALYDAAGKERLTVDEDMARILNNPYVAEQMGSAAKRTAARGNPVKIEAEKPEPVIQAGRPIDRRIDPNKDDLIMAIRKMGGISKENEPWTYMQFPNQPGLSFWRNPDKYGNRQGLTFDDMARAMHERGYLKEANPTELEEILYDAARGTIDPSRLQSRHREAFSNLYDEGPSSADEQLKATMQSLVDVLQQRNAPKAKPEVKPGDVYSGDFAHQLKLSIDDALNSVGDGAIGNNEKSILQSLKRDYVSKLEESIPVYGDARKTFADLSKPINQMDVGRALYEKLASGLADNAEATSRERAAMFANALRDDGEALVKKATGQRAGLSQILEPEQMEAVQGVLSDLQRKTLADELMAARGSDTVQNLLADNFTRRGLGVFGLADGPAKWLANTAAAAYIPRTMGRYIGRDLETRLQKILADAVLDPQLAARLMEDSIPTYSRGLSALAAPVSAGFGLTYSNR